jgi:hypothetical protein
MGFLFACTYYSKKNAITQEVKKKKCCNATYTVVLDLIGFQLVELTRGCIRTPGYELRTRVWTLHRTKRYVESSAADIWWWW